MWTKTNLWEALWHLEFFVLGTLLFILLFRAPLFQQTPFFYRGILLLLVDCLLIFSLIILVRLLGFKKLFSVRDIITCIVLIFSVNLVFFTHLPVTADRSISVFLLGYFNNHPGKLFTAEEITQVFINKYLYENGNIQKRFDEQIVSGNLLEEGKGYKITKRGKFVMQLYNFVADIFMIDKKNISP